MPLYPQSWGVGWGPALPFPGWGEVRVGGGLEAGESWGWAGGAGPHQLLGHWELKGRLLLGSKGKVETSYL